jgi:GR25 family glycosyltransferase involved in LPS biosynthesis
MRNFIIYLPMYASSTTLAEHAFKTGQDHGWNVELFSGVDGVTVANNTDWAEYNIKINLDNKKCAKMLEKPGVRGCFLSHWKLWQLCAESAEPIGIFEHDVEFLKSPLKNFEFDELLRLEGFEKQKPKAAGDWYEGTRGYLIKPMAATKLIQWVQQHGCLPADVNLGSNIIKIELDNNNLVRDRTVHVDRLSRHTNSFTWNLEGMTNNNG